MKRLLIPVALLLPLTSAGCATPARPPFPEPVPHGAFAPRSRTITTPPGGYTVELTGMRVTDQEVYLYAYVCRGDGVSDDLLRGTSLNIGWQVSSEPSRFVEIVSPDGKGVDLLPYSPPGNALFGPYYYPGSPPLQRCDDDCMLQSFIFRTTSPLEPGTYSVRMIEYWNADPMLQDDGAVADTEFHELQANRGT